MAPGSSSTMRPIVVNSGGPVRGIHGLTVNVWSAPYPTNAVTIGTQGSYTDRHCEGAIVCYYITADNVTLMDIHCGPRVTTCVSVAPGEAMLEGAERIEARKGSDSIGFSA